MVSTIQVFTVARYDTAHQRANRLRGLFKPHYLKPTFKVLPAGCVFAVCATTTFDGMEKLVEETGLTPDDYFRRSIMQVLVANV